MKNVVLITGASSGLGKELTRIYIKKKNYSVILSGMHQEGLKEFESNPNVDIISGDLTKEKTRNAIVDLICEKHKRIDILINCAGYTYIQPFEENTEEQLDAVLSINLKIPMLLTLKLYPLMIAQKTGCIININSSITKKGGRAKYTIYSASKFGLEGFTQSLREEARKYGIRVMSVYPGGMKTSFHDHFKVPKNIDSSKYLDPQKVAEIIVFLSETEGVSPDELLINRIS